MLCLHEAVLHNQMIPIIGQTAHLFVPSYTAELINWSSLDGLPLTGILVKPENFDPNKKYPMIVNFYEKSSNGLHRHIAPSPGRSTINYSFYTSRGYLIFIPFRKTVNSLRT